MLLPLPIAVDPDVVAIEARRPESEHTRRPIRWVFAGLLLLASMMNYIDRQTLSVLAVTIQREMRLSDVRYGYVVQCFLLTYMVMYVVSGRLVDRFGAKRTQGVFLLLWSTANALTGLATGFVSLAACRAALGAAEPGNYTASLRAVGDWFSEKQRALAVGIYSMGGTLGAAIAVPLTATLTIRYGWRSAFVVTGAMGGVIALLWWVIYRDPRSEGDGPTDGRGVRAPRVPWKVVLRQPYLFEMLVTRMMTDSVWFFFLFWVSKYMQERHGLSLKAIGATLWVLYVGADAGSLLGGWLSSALVPIRGVVGARFAVMLPVAACMLSLSLVPALQRAGAVIALLTMLALCHMAWMTNVTTLTLDLFPKTMATTVQGMIGAASAAGGLISSGLIARTIEAHGYRPVFVVMAMMHPLAAMILYMRLRPVVNGEGLDSGAIRGL
jgi:ACS family hexuronate transporter-like MFS transporter